MALQGDLSSFALADVLRLLAGTSKSGALEVSSSVGSGEVWLKEGSVVGGAVPGAPHALRGADVVLELLRFHGGSFVFDDSVDITEEGGDTVDATLSEAEGLLAEWLDVESVVPSMDAWLTLEPELSGEATSVAADDWRMVATIGSGRSVRALAGMLELTDLAASRQVKALAEQGLVQVRIDDAGATRHEDPSDGAQVNQADNADQSEEAGDGGQGLAVVASDDNSVVLGSEEDDMLPEPLPDTGSSYANEGQEGSVDGRQEDAEEDLSSWNDMGSAGSDESAAEERAAESWAASSDEESADTDTDADPQVEAEVAELDDADTVDHETPDDRGSLLRFLSTVKP